jgi:hypothetical protein
MDLRLYVGLLESVLPRAFERGHVGVGPPEREVPAVDDSPCPREDPRTGRELAELVDGEDPL